MKCLKERRSSAYGFGEVVLAVGWFSRVGKEAARLNAGREVRLDVVRSPVLL